MVSDTIITFINFLIKNLANMLSWAILLLPESPIGAWLDTWTIDSTMLQIMNYLVPLNVFLGIAVTMLTVYGTARAIWALLRIGRVIE